MLILDTNVFSAMMQPHTSPKVVDWRKRQPVTSVWTATVSLLEIRYGLSSMPAGTKRQALEEAFVSIRDEALDGRVIQIAGIVANRRATLATRNLKDFANTGITRVDPWTA